jgi:hypothetical protein
MGGSAGAGSDERRIQGTGERLLPRPSEPAAHQTLLINKSRLIAPRVSDFAGGSAAPSLTFTVIGGAAGTRLSPLPQPPRIGCLRTNSRQFAIDQEAFLPAEYPSRKAEPVTSDTGRVVA